MKDYNKVILTGRMTRDVEVKTLPNTSVAESTIASNHKFGENKDEVSFFDVVFWGTKAEFASKYLTKGKAVLLEGRLQQQRWEKEGEKRSKIVLVVEDVTFLPGNKNEDSPKSGGSEKSSKNPEITDDIPF